MAPQKKGVTDGSDKGGGAAVASREPGAGLLAERPEHLKRGGTAGRENITAEDILLPRLEVVQALSEAWQQDKPGYIVGAKVGDIVNSVSKKIYDRPLLLIPVMFVKQYNIWKLRKFGGGFYGTFPTMADAQREFETSVPESDRPQYEILDTPVYYGLVIVETDEGTEHQRVSMSLPRTKAKVARRLSSLIDMTGEDAYNRVYALNSVLDKNRAGQEFRNFTVDQLPGWPNEDMTLAAEAFYKVVVAGRVSVNQANAGVADSDEM